MSNPQSPDPLRTELAASPHLFDFFQAVRLLHRWARADAADADAPTRRPVGEDFPPADEVVRFRVLPTLGFPAGELRDFHEQTDAPPEMTVNFLGLIGASGVLPRHYTQLVIERVRRRDLSLRDFLDLFHHRAVSLFYRAWEKYRFPIALERAAADPRQEPDQFTHCLLCLVGMGTERLRRRQQVPEDVLLFYGGHFAHQPRNSIGLAQVVGDYFGLPVEVRQFEGRWLHLEAKDQTRLPAGNVLGRRYHRMGDEALVGARVWSVEHRFRVRVGPLDYRTFRRLTPEGDLLRPMCQLIRTYVGPDFDFDVQVVLHADEAPACRIAAGGEKAARLGWDAWPRNREFVVAVDDAVFEDDGAPDA
jgi:type VI secretion system protein ImpH